MIDFKNLPPKDDRELTLAFRKVFASPDGKMVLAFILRECRLFDEGEGPETEVFKNFGVRLLEQLGTYHELNFYQLVDKILEVDPSQIALAEAQESKEAENTKGEM